MDEWTAKLKDGREIVLRLLKPDDRGRLLQMVNSFSDETLLWSNPPYDEARIDRWMSGASDGLSFVAVHEQDIVGIVAIYRQSRPREQGIGGMMIYLHQDFHGVGLGTIMTQRVLKLAKITGLHRIGLEVVEDNVVAVQLYKRVGFKVEGVLADAYYGADERYHNMLVMGKLLAEE
jgi:putative acetyltransferase